MSDPKEANVRNEIEYSEKVKGTESNYGWAVRFDDTENGFLGVQQFDEHDRAKDRVLLSPAQAEALIRFYRKWHPAKRKAGAPHE